MNGKQTLYTLVTGVFIFLTVFSIPIEKNIIREATKIYQASGHEYGTYYTGDAKANIISTATQTLTFKFVVFVCMFSLFSTLLFKDIFDNESI